MRDCIQMTDWIGINLQARPASYSWQGTSLVVGLADWDARRLPFWLLTESNGGNDGDDGSSDECSHFEIGWLVDLFEVWLT